jgi:hypothetical protein
MILVPLLNPKFANVPAAKSCELRVRGTSRLLKNRTMFPVRFQFVHSGFGYVHAENEFFSSLLD